MTESIDPADDDDVVARYELDTTQEAPAVQLVEVVAALENTDQTALEPIYNRIDELIADLFSTPPPATADAVLEFTYQGYRITVRQDGTTVFRHSTE